MSTQRETDLWMLHSALVAQAMEHDEPVTETRHFGENWDIYSAAWFDEEHNETCWRCDIDTDTVHDGFAPRVSFTKCNPTTSHDILHTWSPIATGRLAGPKKLTAWRALFTVFDAALECYEVKR